VLMPEAAVSSAASYRVLPKTLNSFMLKKGESAAYITVETNNAVTSIDFTTLKILCLLLFLLFITCAGSCTVFILRIFISAPWCTVVVRISYHIITTGRSGISVVSPYSCADLSQFLFDPLVSPVDMPNPRYHCFSLSCKTCQYQGRSSP